jgi:hypothetical protein
MANANGIFHALERKAAISNADPQRHTALRAVADQLSKRNVDAATCELLNEALSRLVQLAYETDAGGLCNIDGATGRFLIPLPFGRNGHAKWGLRPQEANILRQILFDWQAAEPPALLFYDRSRRAWFVDIAHFSNAGIAKAWLRSHQITVAVYRATRRVPGAKRVQNG